jgi:2-oxo-4-hydroxy-4-carboxy-5-ureidoimidazoline decarboxylase
MSTAPPLRPCPREAFVHALDGLYEHSPWVAERAWAAEGFAGVGALLAALERAVDTAPLELRLSLLRAHPELGARSAAFATLTPDSQAEQRGAGLAGSTAAVLQTLADLNTRYRARHDFPFILAVRGRSVPEILDSMRARLDRSTELEVTEALAQVHRIARLRFIDRFGAVE